MYRWRGKRSQTQETCMFTWMYKLIYIYIYIYIYVYNIYVYICIWLQVAVQVARKGANSCIDIHGSVIYIYIYKKNYLQVARRKGANSSVLMCISVLWWARLHVCCSVLQCVAVRCSVLQYVAVCCNVLQSWRVSLSYDGQGYTSPTICCSVWQFVAVSCSVS